MLEFWGLVILGSFHLLIACNWLLGIFIFSSCKLIACNRKISQITQRHHLR